MSLVEFLLQKAAQSSGTQQLKHLQAAEFPCSCAQIQPQPKAVHVRFASPRRGCRSFRVMTLLQSFCMRPRTSGQLNRQKEKKKILSNVLQKP